MTNFTDTLVGLDTERGLRRAAQIALAAIDQIITSGNLDDHEADYAAAVAAYEALTEALA